MKRLQAREMGILPPSSEEKKRVKTNYCTSFAPSDRIPEYLCGSKALIQFPCTVCLFTVYSVWKVLHGFCYPWLFYINLHLSTLPNILLHHWPTDLCNYYMCSVKVVSFCFSERGRGYLYLHCLWWYKWTWFDALFDSLLQTSQFPFIENPPHNNSDEPKLIFQAGC